MLFSTLIVYTNTITLGGSEEERAKKTIVAIENFYNNIMLVKTKISQLDCSQDKKWIEPLLKRLEKDGVKWGENHNVTHKEIGEILSKVY